MRRGDRAARWSLDRRARHVLTSTLAANALLFFDQTAVTVALPAIGRELDASRSELQWVITAYLLALTVFMAAAGRLADRFGRKRFYLAGLVLFGAGSAACALAPDMGTLLVARFVQGAGGAIIQPLCLSATTAVVPDEHRGWAIGTLSTGGSSFLTVGPLVAGALLGVGSWRWIFVLTMPVVVLSIVEGVRWLPPDVPSTEDVAPVEPGGVLLLLGGLGTAVVGITQLQAWGGAAAVLVVVGVAVLAVFARHELRAARPLVPLRALREPVLTASLAALLAIQFVVLGVTVYLVLFLQHGLDVSALAAGLVLALSGVFSPLLSRWTGRLTDEHGPRPLVLPGLLVATAGLVWMAVVAPFERVWWLLPGLLVFSLSRPMVFTPAGVGPTMLLPVAERGFASSLVTESRQLGAVMGVAVLGAVLAGVVGHDSTDVSGGAMASGFRAAMATAAVVTALAAAVVAARMPSAAARRG